MAPAVAAAPVDHSRMDHGKMDHGDMSGTSKTAAPVVAAAPVDHSRMDHSKMDHSVMPGTNQAPPAAPQVAQAASVQGSGTVNSVDAAGHKVNLNHNAIPAIGWPAMTMDFAVAHSVDLTSLKPGTRVSFTLQRGGDGMYVIHSITPAGGQ